MSKTAIDGPSGAGKSSIARAAAKKLGMVYVDTGAMYRAAGLFALENGISISDNPEGVKALLPKLDIKLGYENGEQKIFLSGTDVSDKIRTPEISRAASEISAIPEVRKKLVDLQRRLAADIDVIMDGRDIGTVVFPDAEVKIFLTASPEARAERRFKELCEKGESVTFDEVLRDMKERDENDMTRAASPLKAAEDAVLLDTSKLDFEASVEAVLNIINEKLSR